jgi:hypothetical protein
MKKSILYGFLVISILIATPIAAVFANTSSNSDTVNGYTDNVQVSGNVSGGTVSGYTYLSTGSCTSGTDYCTSSGYYLTIYMKAYYDIGGTYTYYMGYTNGVDISTNSASVTTIQAGWNPGTGTASEAYNEGTAGYTNSGTYTAVTSLIDAGLPYS